MSNTNTYIILIVIGALILAGVIFLFVTPTPAPTNKFDKLFQEEVNRAGVERVGQPIEGFDAFILKDAFPILIDEDFDGVASLEGIYRYDDGKLSYSRILGQPVTSAEQTLSTDGYGTLLYNLSLRLDINVQSEEDMRMVFEKLKERKDTGGRTKTSLEVQKYFNEKLQREVMEKIGQPVEGFVPFMFMEVFLGLVPQDFDGVEAQLGKYEIVEKELVFILNNEGEPIHSAAEAITPLGMEALLSNIQKRADTSITTTEEIDGLLLFLGGTTGSSVFECIHEQRDVDACIQVFEPVCGMVNVQCITTPCDPVFETFSNSCVACSNSLVESYTEGECLVGP